MFSAPTSTDLPYVVAASLLGIVLIALAIVQLRTDRATRSPDALRHRRRNYFPLALLHWPGCSGLACAFAPPPSGRSLLAWRFRAICWGLSSNTLNPTMSGGDILTSSLMIIGIAIQLYRLRRPAAASTKLRR